MKTAQTRLGHSDPRLTLAVYAQATTEADQEAARKLGARFMPSHAQTARDGRAMGPFTRRTRVRRPRPDQGTFGREGGIRTRDLSVPNAAR